MTQEEKAKAYEYIFPKVKESEDENMREGIIRNLEYLMDRAEGFVKDELKKRIAWLEHQGEKGTNGNEREFPIPEPPLTIKHAKEVMGIKQNDAWSKEDEKMFDYALNMIEWYGSIDKDKSKPVSDWLKSLKERYTWKPSDEQIMCLQDAIDNYHRRGYKAETLEILLKQLKQL